MYLIMIDECDEIITTYLNKLNPDYAEICSLRDSITEEIRFRIDSYIVNNGY